MNIRLLLLLGFAWFLLAVAASSFFRSEAAAIVQKPSLNTTAVLENKYLGTTDLGQISGEQVLGMVPYALAGEFPLVVDGITINPNTNISSINFRGVSGLTYSLTVNRNTNRDIISVVANHN
ncbi:hypothetical protein [Paenibacillus cremeus]|uniref:Uncharacterized protein n=1 Tax=Paenibacillus cremeus TaxID=2163881 RepID=A0A559K5E3_9BACL|nr:hypothetical protein [Paenibacillus cremeus]TVY07320.1 hypothetical protein FPZ49_24565 [Paenibacillus cremeus]